MAVRFGLPVIQPERIRTPELADVIAELAPDFLVVAAYGRILPAQLLALPRIAPVNVHGSLLPRYRGAAPIQRALLDGVTETGVTTIWMNERMDEGDILLQDSIVVMECHNAGRLTEALAGMGADLAVRTLLGLADGEVHRTPQNHALATYAPPITAEDTFIRWDEAAVRCYNRVRAMAPRPGATTWFRQKRIKVLEAVIDDDGSDGMPGAVIRVSHTAVVVSTGKGALRLVSVQPEGLRVMPAVAWARGARLSAGERFGEPLRSTGGRV